MERQVQSFEPMKCSYPVGSHLQGPLGTVRAPPLLFPKLKKFLSKPLILLFSLFLDENCYISFNFFNPLSPNIDMKILQTDLHIFLIKLVKRICYEIKVFFLW